MSLNVTGIYKLTCVPTGDFYVGAAKNIEKRRKQHWGGMRTGHHLNTAICYLAEEYGVDSFTIGLLQECKEHELKELELYWAYKLKPTLNGTRAITSYSSGQLQWTPNPDKTYYLNCGVLVSGVFFTRNEWYNYREASKLSKRLSQRIECIRDIEKLRAIETILDKESEKSDRND